MTIVRRYWVVLCLLAVLFMPTSAGPAQARSFREELWVTNGFVNATTVSGNTLYIGGKFSYVGPRTGNLVALTQASGERSTPFPLFDGPVRAVVADGAGGWYVGGSFQAVNGRYRPGLAHLNADLTLDRRWNPVLGGEVYALAVQNNRVYAGFGLIGFGVQVRSTLAAIDANGGIVWNRTISCTDFDTCVYAECDEICSIHQHTTAIFSLLVDGDTLYAGGSFTAIGDQPRNTLAALDPLTGALKPWNPGADQPVITLALQGTTVYAGGKFTQIDGQARTGLAAIDRATGMVTPWNPTLSLVCHDCHLAPLAVHALVVDGPNLYVGGYFSSVGGQPRKSLAAINTSTGIATTWNPGIACDQCYSDDPMVFALARNGSTLYAGGSFTSAGGQARRNLAAIDMATGQPTAWNVHTGDAVSALAASGALLLAGGKFTSAGGRLRENLAALDLTSGAVTAWKPSCGAGCTLPKGKLPEVKHFALSGPTLYISAGRNYGSGPDFAMVTVNTTTGAIGSWDMPLICGGDCVEGKPDIRGLVASGGTLYIAGAFSSIGEQPRPGIAAMDTISNTITSWHPTITGGNFPNPTVSTLAISGTTVYIAGDIGSVGGQPRQGLAAIDTTTGAPTAWNPTSIDIWQIDTLVVHAETVYIGGMFNRPNQLRGLIGVSTATGLPTWTPEILGHSYFEAGIVTSVTPVGDYIFAGIRDWSSGRASLLIYRAGAKTPIPWTLTAEEAIATQVASQDMLYIGGYFKRLGGQPFTGIAAFDTTIVDSLSQQFLPAAMR